MIWLGYERRHRSSQLFATRCYARTIVSYSLQDNHPRTVSTGHAACDTILCALVIGRCVAARGELLGLRIPSTMRSALCAAATSKILLTVMPPSTTYSGAHPSSASAGTRLRNS